MITNQFCYWTHWWNCPSDILSLDSICILDLYPKDVKMTNPNSLYLALQFVQAVLRKANRIAFIQNRSKKQAKQPSPKK